MKIALLDFDDVLFNTTAFSEASRGVFVGSGVSEKEYDEFYQRMREDFKTQNRIYHREDHIDLFTQKFSHTDHVSLRKNLSALNKDMPRFVYADTRDFLKTLLRVGWRRVILTFGNDDWQRKKVGWSGIEDLVDDIVVSPDASKIESAKKILKNKNADSVIFVDDNPYQALNLVKAELPHIKTIQLIRPHLESSRIRHDGCDHNCKGLDEIAGLI